MQTFYEIAQTPVAGNQKTPDDDDESHHNGTIRSYWYDTHNA
jgi:hypothetical protein